MKDVVIVGGGLSGLAAAWRLRHWDTVLLESGSRVGGRIRSERRGRFWLNWGGHVFAGPGTSTDALLSEVGITAAQVPGALAAVSMNGKLLLKGPVHAYPFRIPMPLSSRVALLKAGIKVSGQVLRYARIVRQRPGEDPAVRQQRVYDFENGRSFQDFVGDLPDDAGALFYPTVTRSAADPDEIAAGAGIGYFSLVWNIGQGLNRGIVGGPVHPDPGDRRRPGRVACSSRPRSSRSSTPSGRSSSDTGRTASTTRSRGAASCWRRRPP